MPCNDPSAAILTAAHRLYQFVLARVLELVEVSVEDIEAYLTALGVDPTDASSVYAAAMAEADQRCTDVPPGTDKVYAMGFDSSVMQVWSKICDAQEALADREDAVLEEWLAESDAEDARQIAGQDGQ